MAAAVVALIGSLMAASPAWAATTSGSTGIDVSWPQCPWSNPKGAEAFVIVGVNGGLANDYNSCLGAEFSYAQRSTAELYLSTADPGNVVAGNIIADWPSPGLLGAWGSTSTPNYGTCDYAVGSLTMGANSDACAYIYGYDMVAGILPLHVGDISAFATATISATAPTGLPLYAFPTWLDVETGNSWMADTTMNVADLQGMVDAIHASVPVGSTAASVGIYSTSYQWGQITETPSSTNGGNLWGIPDWIPGARNKSGAVSNCKLQAFTGGGVVVTQWFGHPYDGDYAC